MPLEKHHPLLSFTNFLPTTGFARRRPGIRRADDEISSPCVRRSLLQLVLAAALGLCIGPWSASPVRADSVSPSAPRVQSGSASHPAARGVHRIPRQVVLGSPVELPLWSPPPWEHRLEVYGPGGSKGSPGPSVLLDFEPREELVWWPKRIGRHRLVRSARDPLTGEQRMRTSIVQVRAPGSSEQLLPAPHPLARLYSANLFRLASPRRLARHCWSARARCRLELDVELLSDGSRHRGGSTPLPRGRFVTATVTGLAAGERHVVRARIEDARGRVIARGAPLHVDVEDAERPTASLSVTEAPGASPSSEPFLLVGSIRSPSLPAYYALDLANRLRWFALSPDFELLTDVEPGGLFLGAENTGPDAAVPDQFVLQRDFAGYPRRRISLSLLNEKLVDGGWEPILPVHHDIISLPGGRLAMLGFLVRTLVDVQGPGEKIVLGDAIVVLGPDLEVEWFWDAFEYLDPSEPAILGELSIVFGAGCVDDPDCEPVQDWTHSNALAYRSSDGNLLLSIRHLDRLVLLDYDDGEGSGEVVWSLGAGGDFTLSTGDPLDWFTHQHDPRWLADDRLAVYDNGNTHCAFALRIPCRSRGQVWRIDEQSMTATPELNADMGVNSFALGSAQPLESGGFHFNNGIAELPDGRPGAIGTEVDATGAWVRSLLLDELVYRSWRLPSLALPEAVPPPPKPVRSRLDRRHPRPHGAYLPPHRKHERGRTDAHSRAPAQIRPNHLSPNHLSPNHVSPTRPATRPARAASTGSVGIAAARRGSVDPGIDRSVRSSRRP